MFGLTRASWLLLAGVIASQVSALSPSREGISGKIYNLESKVFPNETFAATGVIAIYVAKKDNSSYPGELEVAFKTDTVSPATCKGAAGRVVCPVSFTGVAKHGENEFVIEVPYTVESLNDEQRIESLSPLTIKADYEMPKMHADGVTGDARNVYTRTAHNGTFFSNFIVTINVLEDNGAPFPGQIEGLLDYPGLNVSACEGLDGLIICPVSLIGQIPDSGRSPLTIEIPYSVRSKDDEQMIQAPKNIIIQIAYEIPTFECSAVGGGFTVTNLVRMGPRLGSIQGILKVSINGSDHLLYLGTLVVKLRINEYHFITFTHEEFKVTDGKFEEDFGAVVEFGSEQFPTDRFIHYFSLKAETEDGKLVLDCAAAFILDVTFPPSPVTPYGNRQ